MSESKDRFVADAEAIVPLGKHLRTEDESTPEDRKNREAARRAANPDPGDADDDEED
jgi:hypothetical protein